MRGHYKRSSLHEQQFNYDEPYGMLRRANSVEPPPPPVPPRTADGTGPRRPPPPRPHSVYAQVRPKQPNGYLAEGREGHYAPPPPPPPLPPPHQYYQYRRVSQGPPPIPPHTHASGVPHPLPLSPPSAAYFRRPKQPRPKSFYDQPDGDHCQQQLRYFEVRQGHFEPPRDISASSSPFYQRIHSNNNRHSFAAFEDDPTPTNSPPPRPPPFNEGLPKAADQPTAVPLLPRRYNSGFFSPIEDRLKEENEEEDATYDELWSAEGKGSRQGQGRRSNKSSNNRRKRKQKPKRQSRPQNRAAAAAADTAEEEEKYSSPVRTKGRKEVAEPSESKIGTGSDANEVPDGEEVVEASESMEIVLHISEDGDGDGDKTDVEAGDEILLDGKGGSTERNGTPNMVYKQHREIPTMVLIRVLLIKHTECSYGMKWRGPCRFLLIVFRCGKWIVSD